MTKAVAYIRVSREDENIENQRLAIKQYAEQHGINVVRYFKDVGVSGGVPVFNRPGFKRLLRFADKEGVRNLIIYDLTRFSRSFYDGLQSLRKLVENGWNIITVSGVSPFSLNFPDDAAGQTIRNILTAVLLAMSEWYRLDVSERTRHGLIRAKKEGKHVGRPPLSPEKRKTVIELYKHGYSQTYIARALSISRTTVFRILRTLKEKEGVKK